MTTESNNAMTHSIARERRAVSRAGIRVRPH